MFGTEHLEQEKELRRLGGLYVGYRTDCGPDLRLNGPLIEFRGAEMLQVNERWATAEDWALGHVRDLVDYTRVSFDDCDANEVAAVYRALAVRLIEAGRGDILVVATGDTYEGHYAVRDVLRALLRLSGGSAAYRFALCADAPRIKGIFHQVRKEFYRTGCEIRVFAHELEAASWYCSGLPLEEQRPQ